MTHIETPRTEARIARALPSTLSGLIARAREWAARRAIARGLAPLDARKLRDIGLTGAERDAALGAPLSQDAADRLTLASLGRAGRW